MMAYSDFPDLGNPDDQSDSEEEMESEEEVESEEEIENEEEVESEEDSDEEYEEYDGPLDANSIVVPDIIGDSIIAEAVETEIVPFPLKQVPDELILRILSKAGVASLARCPRVCKKFESLSRELDNRHNKINVSFTFKNKAQNSREPAFNYRRVLPEQDDPGYFVPTFIAKKYLQACYLFSFEEASFEIEDTTYNGIAPFLEGIKIRSKYLFFTRSFFVETIIDHCVFDEVDCIADSIHQYRKFSHLLKGADFDLRIQESLPQLSYDDFKDLKIFYLTVEQPKVEDLLPFFDDLKQVDTSLYNLREFEYKGLKTRKDCNFDVRLPGTYFFTRIQAGKENQDKTGEADIMELYGTKSLTEFVSIGVAFDYDTKAYNIFVKIIKSKEEYYYYLLEMATIHHTCPILKAKYLKWFMEGDWDDYASIFRLATGYKVVMNPGEVSKDAINYPLAPGMSKKQKKKLSKKQKKAAKRKKVRR